jgi:hypothetical protein
MARYVKWTGLAASVLLIICCFSPWVFIKSKELVVSGIDATGTNFGKPGYFHLIMAFLFIVLLFTPRVWAKRLNLFVTAINFAWAIRNYFIISMCRGGECPDKQSGIYLIVLASLLMLIAALLPDMKLPGEKNNTSAV